MSQQDGFEWRSNAAHHKAQEKMGMLAGYYEWVIDLFGGAPPSPVADAGAGSGHLASLLADRVDKLVLLEGGQENLGVLRERFGHLSNVVVQDCDLTSCEDLLSSHHVRSIVTLDVLEHLPDDLLVLRQFHSALVPGGKVYIKVPALQWLYGPVDEASGHFRRYSRGSLRRVLQAAGFEVEQCRYMNLAAVPSYFIKSRVLKKKSNFSETFSAGQIRRIERLLPTIRTIDRVFGPPLGLSVVAVASKR